MRSSWRYLLVVAVLMAAPLVLAACGGGDEELDLDEYFVRLEDVFEAAETSSETLEEEFPGVGQDIEATRGLFDAAAGITRQALNDLRDIHPPAESRDAHDEIVVSVAEMLASWEDLSDRLANVESPTELEALLTEDDPAFDAAERRVANACFQLQGIADENGVEVDLRCG